MKVPVASGDLTIGRGLGAVFTPRCVLPVAMGLADDVARVRDSLLRARLNLLGQHSSEGIARAVQRRAAEDIRARPRGHLGLEGPEPRRFRGLPALDTVE